MILFDFECLLVISLMEHIVAFRGTKTKSLNRYTPFDKTLKSDYLSYSKKRRLFDYNYEDWFKNNFNNNIYNNIFNTDIYETLRENNNITKQDKELKTNLTSKVTTTTNPTSELKLTTLSKNMFNELDARVTTVSKTLVKPDFRTNVSTTIVTTSTTTNFSNTESNNISESVTTSSTTSITEKDLSSSSNTEPEFKTLTSVSNETTKRAEVTTSDQTLTSVSNISTDLTFDGTTRDWREIINFTVIPEDTIAELLLLYANTTPYITLSSLKPPPLLNPTAFTTNNILDVTYTITTTRNPFLVEIEQKLHMTRDGYFTCILIVLLKHLMEKNASETRFLLNGLNIAIVSMDRDELSTFGPDAVELLQSVVQMLLLEPSDIMREHLKYAIYALENRRGFLGPDINSILTVIDTIYIPNDVYDIADFLRDEVAGFPNKTNGPAAIARKAIDLFIIYPHARIRGTAKSELLVKQLNLMIKSRMLMPSGPGPPMLGEDQGKLRRLNKEIIKSFRQEEYKPRRRNRTAQTFLGPLSTRTRWKLTLRTIHESMRKIETSLDKEKLYTMKKNTKPTYKFRKKHPDKRILDDDMTEKEHYLQINATQIFKLRKKNTHAISDGSLSSASKDSDSISTENKFNKYLKRDKTRNVNQYKKSRRSSVNMDGDNINIRSKKTAIFQERRNNFYRKSNEHRKTEDLNDGYNYSNESFENKKIRAKLVDWVNKYTNVIYQKLNNERERHRTKTLLINSNASNFKHFINNRRSLNKKVISKHKLMSSNSAQNNEHRRKSSIDTSNENDEERILKLNILKAIKNTSFRGKSYVHNPTKRLDDKIIKVKLISLINKYTDVINQKLKRTNKPLREIQVK